MPRVLVIDCGTSNVKAHIWEKKGQLGLLQTNSEAIPKYSTESGHIEQDPLEVLNAVISVVKRTLAAAGLGGKEINAMGIAVQRNNFLFWDSETGSPLTNLISWQDSGFTEALEEVNASWLLKGIRAGSGFIYNIFGGQRMLLASKFEPTTHHVSVKMSAIWRKNEKVRACASRGTLKYGTLDTWLVWNFTKRKIFATDYSCVSATGMWDTFLMEWSGIVRMLCPLPPLSIYPKVQPSAGDYGICHEEFFGANIPIRAVAADQQASLFGQGCHYKGSLKCTIGTGAFVSLCTGNSCLASKYGLYPLVAWHLNGKNTFTLEGNTNSAGECIQWLVDLLGIKDIAQTSALANSVDSSNGVCFVNAFAGCSVPLFDPRARGMFIGLTASSTKAHMVRALLEGVAHNINQIINVIRTDTSLPISNLRVDGGASQNDFLCQKLADLTGMPVLRAQNHQMTSVGTALLAGVGEGLWTVEEAHASAGTSKRFNPKMSKEQRSREHANWLDAQKRTLGWSKDPGSTILTPMTYNALPQFMFSFQSILVLISGVILTLLFSNCYPYTTYW